MMTFETFMACNIISIFLGAFVAWAAMRAKEARRRAHDHEEVDPRESPFYDGPELDGLDIVERFETAKQLRIAARNRRIGKRYT